MKRSGTGSRFAGTLLGGALLAIVGPVAPAAAGLSGPERKAVDITGIDAESTSDATFAEIGFKGKIEEELGTGGLKKASVTIELVPESGATTVITDQKSTRRPKEGRTGTAGRFDVVRNGRLIVVLVEELPAPAAQIVVTTSGPGAVSRTVNRGDVGEVQPENFDELAEEARFIDSDEEARFARERVEEKFDKAEKDLEEAESDADKTIDDIDRAQRDLINAKGAGAARDARERLERLKAKLEKLNQRRRTLRANIKVLERWSGILFAVQGGARFECNDFIDNADPEDELADHPSDPGCVNAVDNDEKDETVPLACPAPGQTTGGIAIINTPQSNSFTSLRLSKAGTGELVLEAPVQGESGGPSPLPQICGPGVNTSYEFRQYTDGTPFGLPDPPSGDRAFRVVVGADNPSGSGNPGGQDASLRFAVGTAPQ